MMEFLNSPSFYYLKSVLEVSNYAATPILAWLAFKALKQIRVTRDIARMQAQRESFRLATERCEQFAKEVIPLLAEFEKKVSKAKLSEKVVVLEEAEGISIDFKDNGKWFDEFAKAGDVGWKLANTLEGWAMWFTCKIADEGIAFRPCGYAFCQGTHMLLPLLVHSNHKDHLFVHSLRLYSTWRDRLELEKNLAKQQQLEKERKKIKINNIKPLGT